MLYHLRYHSRSFRYESTVLYGGETREETRCFVKSRRQRQQCSVEAPRLMEPNPADWCCLDLLQVSNKAGAWANLTRIGTWYTKNCLETPKHEVGVGALPRCGLARPALAVLIELIDSSASFVTSSWAPAPSLVHPTHSFLYLTLYNRIPSRGHREHSNVAEITTPRTIISPLTFSVLIVAEGASPHAAAFAVRLISTLESDSVPRLSPRLRSSNCTQWRTHHRVGNGSTVRP